MKIDRRSFLLLGVGVTAGTVLSPLPWKLTDDLSIWTQNWPWTPIPPDGEINYQETVCSLCPGGCGLTVRKIDDRVVKVEGKEGSPVNKGGVCVLGLSGHQLLYSPYRITTPLKRIGKRGEGKWAKITVNQAISEIAVRLKKLRKKGGSHTLACISGSEYGTVARLFERFLTVYGSPNFFSTLSMNDSYKLMFSSMHGESALPGFDLENSDFVLSFGSGLLDGWGSPVRVFQANSILKQGGKKIVQIEPRLSNTAAKSDEWIPITPGTEGELALGIAYVMIKNSLYNKKFVNSFTRGFRKFSNLVLEKYTPEFVSQKTGVKQDDIIALAREFASSTKSIALCGKGQGSTPGSLYEFMAIHSLNALVGGINKEGGVWAIPEPDYIKWRKPKMDKIAYASMRAKSKLAKGFLNRLPEAVNSSKDQAINVLFVSRANPYYTMADTKIVEEAFNRIPFIVSFSPYMDETAEVSDIIIPDHVFLERYEDISVTAGLTKPIIGLTKPVIKPMFDTIHSGDAIIALANTLGGFVSEAFLWNDYKICLKETLGKKWDIINEEGFWIDEKFKPSTWKNAFKNNYKKFDFKSFNNDFNRFKLIEPEGEKKSYPLLLIPYNTMRISSGFIGNPPFVTKTIDETIIKGKDVFVEINPETAKSYGLSEGINVYLTTPKGNAKVRVHLFDGIMPGLVAMPRGLGHTAYDKYLAGKGVNINELIGAVEDQISGFDAAWGIRAKLSRA